MIKKGEIYVWIRARKHKHPSRILCCVLRVTRKNIEIVRWEPSEKKYAMSWALPGSLIPASAAEKRSYLRQGAIDDQPMQAVQT